MEIPTTELIQACADSGQAAPWQAFVLRYQRPISLSVLRALRAWGYSAPDLVDDLVQETYLKLCNDRCQKLLRFARKHPQAVDGYIKTIATNVARDYIKLHRSAKRGGGGVGQIPEFADPEAGVESAGGEAAIRSSLLMREIDECLERCVEGVSQERDRLIFWLHYQQGMTAAAISTLPGVGLSTKGVESAIFRLTRLVRERLSLVNSQAGTRTPSPAKGFGTSESY